MKSRPLVILAILIALLAYAEELRGPARVIDGETIEVLGERICLQGIHRAA